jgi:hypothetical protein
VGVFGLSGITRCVEILRDAQQHYLVAAYAKSEEIRVKILIPVIGMVAWVFGAHLYERTEQQKFELDGLKTVKISLLFAH